MAAFLPHEDINQTIDGATLTLTDDSNYADNDSGISDADIVTRNITIYDENDSLLDQLAQSLDTPINWTISADGFYRFHLAFSKSDATLFEADVKFLSTRYYNNVQKNIAASLACGCAPNAKKMDLMNSALQLYNAAIDSFMTGDDVNAAQNIRDANTLINKAALC